nr:hypothetical protein [Tanacetum cinerariifolium]
MTMVMTIDQQVALDEALVPQASRLRIGKSNFRLRSDITSKESTLQLATATVHHHSIRFKMNNKKRIVNLEYFREMLHICTRIPNQTFDELSFEEEILAFLRYLRHSGEIKKITNVNINKLHQPWRSFAAVINKCLSGKSTGYDSIWLSQAQILWGMYHKKNVDFSYLLDDQMFTMIKLVSRHQKTQQFGAMLPVKLTNEDIRNSAAYKEYYAIALGAAPPKTKASVRKMQSSSDTIMPPPMVAGTRLSTLAKGKQPAKSSKAKGLTVLSEVALIETEQIKVLDVPTDESDEEISWKSSDKDDDNDVDDQSEADDEDDQEDEDEQDDDDQDSDNDGDDFVHPKLPTHDKEAKDEESFDPIVQTPGEEGPDAEDNNEELYRDVDINLEGRDVQMTDVHTTQLLKDTHVTLTLVNPDGQQQSSVDAPVSTTVVPLLVTAPTLPPPSIPIMSQVQQAPAPTPTTAPSSLLQDLPNFGSLFGFDHRLKTLEANLSEFMQTNQFAGAVSSIPGVVDRYIDHRMNEAVKIIKEQVKIQVSKIFPKIEKTVNEQLEAEVLTQSSNSSKTSYAVAADLSELELKKILIEKMEINKSIHRSDEQRNLYKALVDPYESDKIILDTYGDTVMLKRRRDDADKDEEPSAGSDRGSIQPWISDLAKQADSRASFNELMDTPVDFSAFLMNRLNIDTLTLELLAGPTYELMKRSCKSLVELKFFFEEVYKATTDQLDWNNPEGQQYPHNLLKPLPLIPNSRGHRIIPFDHFINNDLEYLRGGASSQKYTTSVTKTNDTDCGHIKWIEDLGHKRQQFYGYAVNRESARDVYSKRKIIAVTELQIVEWHDYKHMDWITVRRDDGKLYRFKEGGFKRLHIQDIEDMLLLLVQGKLTNLTVEERFSFNVSLRMFTRSIVIQRRVEDLQLVVKSYQKKLNLTKLDTLRQIDELQKFSDVTLNDVRTALDNHLKGIWMKYLPQSIWRRSDKERAAAMIQAIDKQLKTKRIMRSLEKFVGGRLYEGDFRMLQRTI